MKMPDTPSKVLNAPSHVTNTPSQCRRNQVGQPKQQVRQPKQQVGPILIYAVLSRCNFCRKFMHFSGVQFTGQNRQWRTKNYKYEVWSLGCMTYITWPKCHRTAYYMFSWKGWSVLLLDQVHSELSAAGAKQGVRFLQLPNWSPPDNPI